MRAIRDEDDDPRYIAYRDAERRREQQQAEEAAFYEKQWQDRQRQVTTGKAWYKKGL